MAIYEVMAVSVHDLAHQLGQYAALNPQGLPPVHLWDPPFCGDMDLRIARDGQWYYMGSPIRRLPLVKLFSRVLKRGDDGEYYLVTPVEKLRIQVEDAPFVVSLADRVFIDGRQDLIMTTLTEEVFRVDENHQIWVDIDPISSEPSPYVHVRSRLHARIGRNPFYQLVAWGEEKEHISLPNRRILDVSSAGIDFLIAEYPVEPE